MNTNNTTPPDAPELPPNLPPQPPIPDGYDRWEYRGKGWKNMEPTRIATCLEEDGKWVCFLSDYLSSGNRSLHYIEAVKDSPAATGSGEAFEVTPQLGRPVFLGPPAHDWPEDFSHENGKYFVPCKACGVQFMGHKRRPLCKVCAEPPVTDSLRETPRCDKLDMEYLGHPTGFAVMEFARTLERELAEANRRNAEHMTMNTRWQDVGQAFGCPPGMRIDKYMLHMAPKLTAAQQDSKRLEWLLDRFASRFAVIRTREEIDDAMNKENNS